MTPNAEAADGALLLTGATGFLGQEVLARLLRDGRPVIALVRAEDDEQAKGRVDAIVRGLGHEPDGSVCAAAADLTAPGLGLEPATLARLSARTTAILHCAASVSFTEALPESRAVNVEGTRRMLELARRCQADGGLERFAYVSTAYVSGRHRGRFAHEDLQRGQAFRNPYEQSKQEAETLVREAAGELPVQVFRPSIVVGDQHTGWTTSFNVIYQPLRAFNSGHYKVLPGRLSAPVDVVPVDYVADAIVALLQEPFTSPETHPLVAGPDAASVRELVALASRLLGRPEPRVVPPVLFRLIVPLVRRRAGPAGRAVLEQSAVYFPYFSVKTRFDPEPTRARLEALGIRTPDIKTYLPHLLDFARSTRWGKRMPTRAQALETESG